METATFPYISGMRYFWATRFFRRVRPLWVAIGLIVLQGCFLDPIPETPTPPAGDIRVNLDVVYETPYGEYASAYFEARFFDKHDKRIMLDKGSVTLNGHRMWQASGDYYELSSNDDEAPFYFRFDSLYTFRISLDSTGPEYVCFVRSQRNRLNSYSLAVVGDSARISWVGDTTLDIRLKYSLNRIVNNTRESVSRSKTFSPPQSGEVRVPLEGYSEITLVSLETVVSGTVDSAFRSGSVESMVRLTP